MAHLTEAQGRTRVVETLKHCGVLRKDDHWFPLFLRADDVDWLLGVLGTDEDIIAERAARDARRADWKPNTWAAEGEAGCALEAQAAAWDAGRGPIPVKRQFTDDWTRLLGQRAINRVWDKVADGHPLIKGGKGKPRPRRPA